MIPHIVVWPAPRAGRGGIVHRAAPRVIQPRRCPMPKLTLNLDALTVETFATAAGVAPTVVYPRTHEPGCTGCDVCGGTTCERAE
jgi:hypothetical protein